MIKYIVLAVIVLSAYQYYLTNAGFDFSSNKYNFKITFPGEPKREQNNISFSKWGEYKLIAYRVEHENLACGLDISDYSKANKKQSMGNIDDVIQSIEDDILKEFGGVLDHSGIIFKGDVKGYEIYITTNNGNKVSSRAFQYSDNIYNLTCHIKNTESNSDTVNDYMESFTFMHLIKK